MKWSLAKDLLAEPFPQDQIHWRIGATTKDKSKGIPLAYIDARNVMNRLDDVCGAEWQCDYPMSAGSLLICRVGLKIDGEWLWRSNGAGDTDVEAEKGKASDAFKRAAVLWGVGQYLYSLPNTWVTIEPAGKSHKIKNTPQLPSWALPNPYHLSKRFIMQGLNKEEREKRLSSIIEKKSDVLSIDEIKKLETFVIELCAA